MEEDGGRVLHPADSPCRRAGHPEPAAALVAHRPCLLLVDGLLVGLQHLLQRQFPGLRQVPGSVAVRGGGHPWVPILAASVSGSGHGCDAVEPILYSASTGAIDADRLTAQSAVQSAAQTSSSTAAAPRYRSDAVNFATGSAAFPDHVFKQ